MGFPILVRRHRYIESGPWAQSKPFPENSENGSMGRGVVMYYCTQGFFKGVPKPKEVDFSKNYWCNFVGWPYHPTPKSLLHGKYLMSWRMECEFHLFIRCSNPLAPHQHVHELGHGHQNDKDWSWTQQQISKEPVLIVSDLFLAYPHETMTAMIRNQYGYLAWRIGRHLSEKGETTSSLISCTLRLDAERNLFPPVIRRRARFSFGMVIINRCPRDLCVALSVLRAWCRTLKMVPCGIPLFLDAFPKETPKPDN